MFFKLKKDYNGNKLFRKLHLLSINAKQNSVSLKVKDILDAVGKQKLVHFDEGFDISYTICNSPAYLEKYKKDVFAMIRQLGFPSLFMSQSAAGTKWPELL